MKFENSLGIGFENIRWGDQTFPLGRPNLSVGEGFVGLLHRGVMGGVDSTPYLLPLFESQFQQNLVECKYVTNFIQNLNKIDDVITGPL